MAKKTAKKKTGGKTKWCFKCQKEHPISEFASNKSKPDGLATMCRKKYAEYQAKYRAKQAKAKAKPKKAAPKKKAAKKAA